MERRSLYQRRHGDQTMPQRSPSQHDGQRRNRCQAGRRERCAHVSHPASDCALLVVLMVYVGTTVACILRHLGRLVTDAPY